MKKLAFALVGIVAACAPKVPMEELVVQFRQECSMFGFEDGSEAMAACIADRVSDHEQRENERRARIGAAISEASQKFVPKNSPTSTTCTGYGNTVRCNSW